MNSAAIHQAKAPRFHYAWLVMIGYGMLMCGTIGSFTVLGSLFFFPVSESIGCSLSELTLYVTVQMISMALAMPLVGNLLSRVKLPIILTVATIVEVVAMFSMAFFTEVWMWYAASVVVGIGLAATSTVTITPTLGNWFHKKTGFAIGVVWSIQSIYCAIASPLFSNLIATVGWRTGYMVLAGVAALLAIPFTVFVIRYRPEDKGMLPYGYDPDESKVSQEAEAGATSGVPLKVAVRSIPFFLCIAVVMLCQLTAGMNTIFPTYAEVVGLGAVVGGLMVTAASIFDIFLNPAVGATSDRLGATKSMIIWTGVTMISFGILAFASTSPLLAFLGAGINDAMYVISGVGYATFAMSLFGMKDFEKIFSRITMVGFLVASLGVPLMMWIYESTGAFQNVFLFCLIVDVAIMVFVLLANKAGKKLPWIQDEPAVEQAPVQNLAEEAVA